MTGSKPGQGDLLVRSGQNGDAVFSHDGLFRYNLTRSWGTDTLFYDSAAPRRLVLWVMLNPSTADESKLDPTLTRCANFSRNWGYDGMIIRNAFAYRTPSPAIMLSALADGVDVVGALNDQWLARKDDVSLTVIGWGAEPLARERAKRVCELLGDGLMCMGTNIDGSPKHPLYLLNETRPIPFELAA